MLLVCWHGLSTRGRAKHRFVLNLQLLSPSLGSTKSASPTVLCIGSGTVGLCLASCKITQEGRGSGFSRTGIPETLHWELCLSYRGGTCNSISAPRGSHLQLGLNVVGGAAPVSVIAFFHLPDTRRVSSSTGFLAI